MNHVKVGTFLAVTLSLATAALSAWALQPVQGYGTLEHSLAGVAKAPATPSVPELAPVLVTAVRGGSAVKRAKRKVCDVRGNTLVAGYAVPSLTLVKGETVATVCWWE